MTLSDLARHQSKRALIEEYHAVGFNYRMTDLQAAVGIEQLKKLPFMLERRKQIAARYNEALGVLDWVHLPFSSSDMPHTYQSYMIQLRAEGPKSRDQVMQEMLEAGVATRRGVMAIHLEPAYRHRHAHAPLPITEEATRQTLLLPNYATMTEDEQAYVIEHLLRILGS